MANHTAVTGIAVARTKLGALVVTVALKFVPNYSITIVTKMTQ